MSVDTCVSSSASQVLAFAERNMLAIRVLVAFCQTEIDDEDVIFVSIVASNQKVVGLDISMYNSLFMDLLNSLNLFKLFNEKYSTI